ncbi:MAG: ECF-type sigma factor [Rubricoccaceae bacterium]|nr:ECF-type sigma factor [Rubricoccaceae bacterium]
MSPSRAPSELLDAVRAGDAEALDRLYGLFYDELRAAARRQLARHQATLQATELVHEAYAKLVGRPLEDLRDAAHLLAIAARAMRQVLVDRARRRQAEKRGGALERATLTDRHLGVTCPLDDILTLDAALDRLDRLNPRLRQTVELRFFGGLTEEETAAVLGCTARTVRRDWTKARLFLHRELLPAAA